MGTLSDSEREHERRMSSPNRRRETDVMKLMMSDYEVTMVGDSTSEFQVLFKGPADSPYEGGAWKINVELPVGYPFQSPSIGFLSKIFHPNIDEASGSVCLDVLNQTWTPMYELRNVFEVFLPQLLLYPNPTDPLNGEAAALLMREPEMYKAKVKDYVKRFAPAEALGQSKGMEDDDDEDLDDLDEDLDEVDDDMDDAVDLDMDDV